MYKGLAISHLDPELIWVLETGSEPQHSWGSWGQAEPEPAGRTNGHGWDGWVVGSRGGGPRTLHHRIRSPRAEVRLPTASTVRPRPGLGLETVKIVALK